MVTDCTLSGDDVALWLARNGWARAEVGLDKWEGGESLWLRGLGLGGLGLGIDRDRVAMVGTSSGANIATVAAMGDRF